MELQGDSDLLDRVERTLTVMHEWGYAPKSDTLASDLLGGPIPVADLRAALRRWPGAVSTREFVCLRGHEPELLEKSRARTASHRVLNGHAHATAIEFASDLASLVPFVDCIALSGSLASGGYAPGDDIDFDLVVRNGTKYTSYLLATLLGLKYAMRYRGKTRDPFHGLWILPKPTCINVVWPREQTQPFVRQDVGLAFELLRCQPLSGSDTFRRMLEDNEWLRDYFPQLYDRVWTDVVTPKRTRVAEVLEGIGRHRLGLQFVEFASRRIAWVLYRLVHLTRERSPSARERLAFLRRVKFPYEVFQD